MEFEKEVKKIVDNSYDGDVDKFLSSLKLRAITFLLFGGSGLLFSMLIYKMGGFPIATSVIGIIFMIIGMLLHFMYNETYKALK